MTVVGLAALTVGWGALAARGDENEPEWALEGAWSDTCSCQIACPCMFGSDPTEGYCEGTSLIEIDAGHYGGVRIDGLAAMASYKVGSWARIYVGDTATPEQAEAVAAVVPLAVPFLGMGTIETVEVVPISVERTATTLAFAAPESSVEIGIVIGAGGEPVKIANLPVKGLPFPEVRDHTQYRSVRSTHHSDAHHFEWSGRNGFVAKLVRAGGS